ncbi:MAG: ROK family protein [Planctomycetota bacterium]|nr:ROK family protein [Planctomycetota bacterium]
MFLAIDLGAGGGAKLALYDSQRRLLRQTLLPRRRYGETAEALADQLAEAGKILARRRPVSGIGIASPGLFRRNGTYLLAANLPFLNNQNLPRLMAARLDAPAGIENDANAGGLAEWAVLQCELLYWVLGGGWGGAWISRCGEVRFPALDWNGDDRTLHYSNEPGYAIPLSKARLRRLFANHGISWEIFEANLLQEQRPADGVLRGPAKSSATLRAESIVSGTGRWRLFQAASADQKNPWRYLDRQGQKAILDPGTAGPYLNLLSRRGIAWAVRADRLFGAALAEAADVLLQQARQQGCPPTVPIAMAGKPSKALPYFGPAAQQALVARGYEVYLRPSAIEEIGGNANLLGACVVAERAAGFCRGVR